MDRIVDRRTFVAGSLGIAATIALPGLTRASDATPETSWNYPTLEITLTDDGFEFPQPLQAGRYAVTVANTGTSADSHFALGKIPDDVTDTQYQAWLARHGEDTDDLTFEDIAFVGVPDWPPPGGSVSGIVDLDPGRYFLFDPFDARGYRALEVGGTMTAFAEPSADCTVNLHEMAIDLPDAAFTSRPVRWKIENTGGMSHEVAILSRPPDFTEDDLKAQFTLPEDATPPPGTPLSDYHPVAAIGILAPKHTSWVDVQLKPGAYVALCMLPFTTGYPHAMDGMYRFFEIE